MKMELRNDRPLLSNNENKIFFPIKKRRKTKVSVAATTTHTGPYQNSSQEAIFFFFSFFFLNYESMITHLQETWKIQNKVTYSSTIHCNSFK